MPSPRTAAPSGLAILDGLAERCGRREPPARPAQGNRLYLAVTSATGAGGGKIRRLLGCMHDMGRLWPPGTGSRAMLAGQRVCVSTFSRRTARRSLSVSNREATSLLRRTGVAR